MKGDLINIPKHKDLVYDIGMHKGEDTEFYLRKGFRESVDDSGGRDWRAASPGGWNLITRAPAVLGWYYTHARHSSVKRLGNG